MTKKSLAEQLNGNEAIAKAIDLVNKESSNQNYRELLETIQRQIAEKRCFLIPVEYGVANDGRTITGFRAVQYENERYMAAFTSLDELQNDWKIPGLRKQAPPMYDGKSNQMINEKGDQGVGHSFFVMGGVSGVLLRFRHLILFR